MSTQPGDEDKKSSVSPLLVTGLVAGPFGLILVGFFVFMLVFAALFGGSSANATPPSCDPINVVSSGGNVATAVKFYTTHGFTLEQAAGLVGNQQVESGPSLDPKATNSLGFKGISQWDPGHRWPMEKKFAAHLSKSPYDLAVQLRYTAWELGATSNDWPGHQSPYQGVFENLMKSTTANTAAEVIFSGYEAPGDGSLPARQKYARAIVAQYKKPKTDLVSVKEQAATDPGNCDASANGSVKALQATALKYAWPNGPYPDGHLAQTPGYKAAIAAVIKHGRYVDQLAAPTPADRPKGDDCGVFVTTLLYNSGWDKTYNYSADPSKGAGNTTVQLQWLEKHWQKLGSASDLKVSDLRPGDVGISATGSLHHVWIYVGKFAGFDGQWAEASQAGGSYIGFAPQARNIDTVLYAEQPSAMYFRKK